MHPRTVSRDGERRPDQDVGTVAYHPWGLSMHRLKPRLWARHRDRSPGQGLVEFALILPIMLTFFATALDLGRIAYAQVTVTNAAREGAFQASQTPTSFIAGQPCTSGNQSTNLVMCRTLLESTGSAVTVSPSDVSVTCNPVGCAAALGNTVSVTVTGRFRLLTPLLSGFFSGQDLTFVKTSRTQLEVLPTPPTATPTPTPVGTPSPTPTPAPTPTPIPGCGIPSAGFTYTTSPASNQGPVTMTVTDTSTSPGTGCAINTWTWNWGDGTTSTGQSPSPHIYGRPASNTTYQVSLTVANGTGSNTSGVASVLVKK